jgi:TPR repeat protein
MTRVKVNDPIAITEMGKIHRDEGDYGEAFEYFKNAAALGDMDAHYNMSILYRDGQGIDKDEQKYLQHLEEAAIGGHPSARWNLACYEGEKSGRHDRAMKHFIIAANLGCDNALKAVRECFSTGIASKEDYEAALRGHQAAVEETKSEQRELVEKTRQKVNHCIIAAKLGDDDALGGVKRGLHWDY